MFEWIKTWTPTLQVIASTILSGALVYLYHRQRKILAEQIEIQEYQTSIQRKQNDIMKEQQNLQKREYRPKILIEGWNIRNDVIVLDLTNVGEGDAFEIKLFMTIMPKSEIYYPDGDFDKRKYQIPLYDTDDVYESQYARVLDSSKSKSFKSNESIITTIDSGNSSELVSSFDEILDDIERDFIEITFEVEYEDVLDDHHRNDFARISLKLPSEDDLTFQEVLSNSPEVFYMDDTIKPDFHQKYFV